MEEAQIRKIVRDEMSKNDNSGSPNVAPHEHNGNDNLSIPLQNLTGTSSIPANNIKYANPETGFNELGYAADLTGGDSVHESQYYATPQILATVPIPVIQGNGVGVQGAFNGGYAEDGTVVLFANGNTLSKLNVRYAGQWYQFNVDSVI